MTTGTRLPVEDPSTGEVIAHVARGTGADVDTAVAAARAAAGRARATSPAERGRALRRRRAPRRDDPARVGIAGLDGARAGRRDRAHRAVERAAVTGRGRGLVALGSYLQQKTVIARVARPTPEGA